LPAALKNRSSYDIAQPVDVFSAVIQVQRK
jgi:hypothetical protein